MIRSERMERVADIARDRERRTATGLAELRRLHEEQSRRLQGLQQFQREYAERLGAIASEGIAIQQLNQYRRFNDRLAEAIAQQQRIVEEAQARLDQQSASLTEASLRRRALDETVTRFRAEETVHAARKEQREADDRAPRIPINFD